MGAAHLGHRLKYVLQDLSCKQFFDPGGQWTNDPNEALEFGTVEEAIAAMDQSGIRDGRIVERQSFGLGGSRATEDQQSSNLLDALRRNFR